MQRLLDALQFFKQNVEFKEMKKVYPDNWVEIAKKIKEKNNWRCERCGHPHDPDNGYCLTVHHLDRNPSNCAEWNLACLCQRCHLHMQHVNIYQGWLFDDLHSDWFRPHLEGFLKAGRNED